MFRGTGRILDDNMMTMTKLQLYLSSIPSISLPLRSYLPAHRTKTRHPGASVKVRYLFPSTYLTFPRLLSLATAISSKVLTVCLHMPQVKSYLDAKPLSFATHLPIRRSHRPRSKVLEGVPPSYSCRSRQTEIPDRTPQIASIFYLLPSQVEEKNTKKDNRAGYCC